MSKQQTLNQYKKSLAKRIKAVRQSAGYKTIADLNVLFPDWSPSRLGNYEAGVSIPNPLDVQRIAEATRSNPSWIYFETGSMFSLTDDIQNIRSKNFVAAYNTLPRGSDSAIAKALKIKPKELIKLLSGENKAITASICRKVEKFVQLENKWMDTPYHD